MRFPARLRVLLAAVLVLAAPLAGQNAGPAGHWEGAIELPGQKLEVRVNLTAEGAGWKGRIDIPAQGAKDLSLASIKAEGATVSFAISGIPGNPTFEGKISAGGETLSGNFSQGGQSFPFSLARKADPAKAAAESLAGFSDFIKGAMKDWNVPGLAVAVVKDDAIIFSEGFGFRDVKKQVPVTRDTLFAIGSSTKAFTVMALGLLAEDGKLSWDEPIRTYLPGFKLKSDFATDHMTPRDLVTHRSGLPRHDFVWYSSSLSRRDLVERLRYLEPNADFRARWQYQNLMFLTAGHLAGEVAGMSWEDLVKKRIFEPLGMKNSNFSVEDSKKSPDFALPYSEKEKATLEIPFRNITTVGPAGSINSSAAEMTQWVRLHLGSGKIGEKRLISANGIAEMHKPQMVMPDPPDDPEIVNRSYGLGWFVESYRGHVRVHHGGNIDGFSAQTAFLPREGAGLVVLTNLNGTPLPDIVARYAFDRLLGLDPIDWNARILQRRQAAEKAEKRAKGKAELDRKMGSRPAHPLVEYVGEFDHPAYGTIGVARDGNAALKATFHDIPMRLTHWHYETFRVEPQDPALAEEKLFLLFRTNAKGDVDGLSIPLEPSAPEIVFTKKPPARLSDPAFLKTLEGTFAMVDNPSFTVTFTLKGDILTATVPGQPTYTLEPYRGTEFKLKELTGFTVRFLLDAKGAVTEVLLLQPDGAYSAKRKG